MTTSLSPERKKFLRGRHPLFKRLSGDVIWGLYEELGYDDDACGTAMDDFFVEMTEVLTAMDCLERNAGACFTVTADTVPCAQCQAVFGAVFTTSAPDWRHFLPPFAVGCQLRCTPLPPEHDTAAEDAPRAAPANAPPQCGLLCPLLTATAVYTSSHTSA